MRPRDEVANFVTHLLGFLLSLAGAFVLMELTWRTGDRWALLGCGAYSLSLVCLYGASALSHAFYDLHRRLFYRKVDQVCIFYLIAGSYTPFGTIYLRHSGWPILTISMWVLATIGAAIVWYRGFLSPGAQKIYLLLGWLPAISLVSIVNVAPPEVVFWIVLGGLFYTVGTLFLWYDNRVIYFHALWHTFVIAGSTCQFISILLLVSTQFPAAAASIN
ncbi:PAQR family membrane homeostasis protein TrhA [Planctomicrobium sp. SH661]|uniref:PAQR family membrane homeostasis protein TrhA n=1 Tax=Planctomicrobium sp. SH661 TaxID=3448124 RepID=UPI003F5B9AC3